MPARAAVAVAGAAWQRQCRRCSRCRCCISIGLAARAVLVWCAGKDLQESNLHPRSHSNSSSSDFKQRRAGRIQVHAQAREVLETFNPSSFI